MPRNIRELIRGLEAAGFENREEKGSDWNSVRQRVERPVTVPGQLNDDPKPYIERGKAGN